jgi:PAS domain S-box-containing protein
VEALLRRLIAARTTVRLPSPGLSDKPVQELLSRCGASSAMLVPLYHVDEPVGALFMLAQGKELEQEDWQVFAQGVGNQIAQALALARAFARREVAEQRALESQAEWRALVENAPDTIMRLDRDGIVQFVSRVIDPWTREEILGKTWLAPIPVEYHPTLSFAIERAMTLGEASSHEIMLPGSNGHAKTEWLSSRIGPISTNGTITGAIVISRHITQKKQQEAQLIVSDRMASVGTLAAGVAHEINNPLAAVIANLDLAHREALEMAERTGNRDMADYLQDAQEAAERVRLIVRDLKVFSRAEEDRMGPTDLRAVLESTLRMAWNEIRHRARLVKDFAELPPVEANESRLGQVFLNLIINATHAIPEGQANQNQIRISAHQESDSMVVVEVTDTGVGMSEEVQRRLFTPFFTTKPVGVGTGLGLSICQRLITAMGGEIRVRSVLGQGSTFSIFLPIAKMMAATVSAHTASSAGRAARRGRILVIDDEPVIATAVQRSLSREHDVVFTNSAQEALAKFQAGQKFDVVLCDLMMPEMTGMDLHAEVMKFDPELARLIIYVTGGAFTARASEFLEAVPNLRIEKPFNVQQLRALVNERVK